MHVDDFTSIALCECNAAVFVIVGKLHCSAVRKLLVDDTESFVIGIFYGCDMAGIFNFRDSSVFPIGISVLCPGCCCHFL